MHFTPTSPLPLFVLSSIFFMQPSPSPCHLFSHLNSISPLLLSTPLSPTLPLPHPPPTQPSPLPISLLQDPFYIWESSGRALDRFTRGKERHIFLYEKVIIFTKKIEAPVQHRERKSDSYKYKNHVEVCVCMWGREGLGWGDE